MDGPGRPRALDDKRDGLYLRRVLSNRPHPRWRSAGGVLGLALVLLAAPVDAEAQAAPAPHRARIMDFAAQHRLPGVHGYRELVGVGGLMS